MLHKSSIIIVTDKQTDRQTDRETDRQADRQTGRQTHRQTDGTAIPTAKREVVTFS